MVKEHHELKKRPCDPSPELLLILLRDISIPRNKVETYEGYAEQEKSLRTQAVQALRKHEERRIGNLKEIPPESHCTLRLSWSLILVQSHRPSHLPSHGVPLKLLRQSLSPLKGFMKTFKGLYEDL